MATKQAHRVVVVGGGYAGMIAALRVAARGRRRVHVTLVDPKGNFVQRLRLQQVATGQTVKAPAYAKLLGRRVEFVQATVRGIDTDGGALKLDRAVGRELPFDHLVYTVGSRVDADSVPGASEFAHTVADAPSARELGRALRDASAGTLVTVVGGGMTGIEVASEIATTYPALRVRLITRGSTGSWLCPRGREHLEHTLVRQGVALLEGATVNNVVSGGVTLAGGETIPAGLIVWCGGFRAHALAAASGLATDHLGRAVVDRTLRSVSHPEIIVAGDAAATPPFGGEPLRMCCQVAMPSGAHAARTALALVKGRDPKDLHFGYLHQPISLGRRDGLIQFVDRADRPKHSVLTGRRAAMYKEFVTRGGLSSIKLERRLPGSTKWPFKEPKQQALLTRGATADG
jgi:NADH:ubiquinone reductase (H+-translocating)